MPWNPNATVTIAGVDFTGNTLNGLAIHYGRPTIWEQARSSYATIDILNTTNANNDFEINDSVVVTVQDSDGTTVTVFTGVITEVRGQIAASGTNATVAVETITAVGPFAQMSRTTVGKTAYPKEYDDDRITRILTEAGVTVDVVDTPGVYELTARAANPVDAYTLATYYAGMCFGYMYETKTGAVGYANESRRTVDVSTSGYLDIDEGYINWRGINSRKSIADILNRIILFYKDNEQVTADDTASITSYGLYEATVSTELHNLDEAQNIADRYVSLRSIPEYNFSSFSINLDNPNLLAADLDALINIEMGTAIEIDNLPNAISHITYQGFVEGWDLVINEMQANLTITSSDSTYSVVPIRWQDVDPTTQWDDLDPTAVKTTLQNEVENPSFENGTTGWQVSNSTISQNTSLAKFGSASLECVATTTTNNSGTRFTSNATYRIPYTAGETFSASCWVRNLVGTRQIYLTVRGFATATSATALETFTSSVTTSTTFTRLTRTFAFTNPSVTYFEFYVRFITTGSIGDSFLLDGCNCVLASSNDFYWDGSTTDIPASRRPELAWVGTAGLSESTAEAYFGDIPTLTWANVDTVGLP